MSAEFLLSFNKDVLLIAPNESEQITLVSGERQLTFKNAQPGLIYALESLKKAEITAAELKQFVLDKDGFEARIKFIHHLKKLINLGWISHYLVVDGDKIATAIPVTSNYEFPQLKVAPENKYILSRFAVSHQNQGKIILKSSYSPAEIVLDWRGGALVSLLSIPQTLDQISAQIPGISPKVIEPFLSLLLGHAMLAEVQANGEIVEAFTKNQKRKNANDYKWLIPRHFTSKPTEQEKLSWDEIHKDYEKHIFSVTPDTNLCEAIIHPSVRVPNFDIPNSPDIQVLIPGCGSEVYIQKKLLEFCPKIQQIFCTDFSSNAISKGQENLQEFSRKLNLKADQFVFEEADSTKLTEQKSDWKSKFDYVIVVNAVVSDDDLKNRQMIREFYQVLKPGGKIYGFFPTIYCDLEIAYLDSSKSHWLTDSIINLTDSANYYHKNRYNRQILYTPLRLNRIFQEAGFQRLGFEVFFNDSDNTANNYREKLEINDLDIVHWQFLVRYQKP
ncbi:methyltransferase [Nostoc sp. KVJ3]|uniref:methyltransferase domain-containing protein n=1 Tax=Nostoc sp. KVJ3 TaxID=457945 RepID=UPI002237AFE6|nr:methyltransferase [Nostoc sp. KVJ3]MCW5317197.1 methyltransferase [Nostoc sp. KVJ3]